jgi:hypothetical protein
MSINCKFRLLRNSGVSEWMNVVVPESYLPKSFDNAANKVGILSLTKPADDVMEVELAYPVTNGEAKEKILNPNYRR